MAPVELGTAQSEFDPEFMTMKLIPQYEPFETESLLRAFLDMISTITRLKLGYHAPTNLAQSVREDDLSE